MIWEELDSSIIYLNLDASNTDEIFQIMGSKLIEKGIVKDTYVDALKEREASFPTGIIINEQGLAIALPHTSVDYVNDSAISIATLSKPVDFKVMGGDENETCKVSLVCMMSVIDPNAHLEQLQQIVQIFQNSEIINKINNQTSAEGIINVIKNKEEELCQKK